MNRRLIVLFGAIIGVFVIAIVGASSLNLTGSDSAPGEGKTVAACANNLVVKSVVDTSAPEANTVSKVIINGDMTQCVGQQMRVEVDKPGTDHAWAVYTITTPINSLTLDFDATTGVFYDAKPTATSGILQSSGTRIAPLPVTDFGQVTVTIAKTWE